MDSSTYINALLLCLLNASFMVAGTFLNSVVIISLWRSSQLRKKLCYLMILVLSCFDLAVVTINHPVLILSTILWSMKTYHKEIKIIWEYTSILLGAFSAFALLTLNIERFLALTYPFFHQTAVTKRRLVLFQAFWMTIIFSLSPLAYFYGETIGNICLAVFVVFLLFLFTCLNYKIFMIAKAKRKEESAAPTSATSSHEERKKRKINLKNISTCCLAVGCFFICSFPQIIYSVLRFTETVAYDRHGWLFNLWSTTLFTMNSTFNCLIFFWRNSVLRREGMKIAKCFRTVNS